MRKNLLSELYSINPEMRANKFQFVFNFFGGKSDFQNKSEDVGKIF